MVVGITANCWPPVSSQTSLLMADLRCLPGRFQCMVLMILASKGADGLIFQAGMEGAPTFNKDGAFVGMLARPLRQRGGGAEVQVSKNLHNGGFSSVCYFFGYDDLL